MTRRSIQQAEDKEAQTTNTSTTQPVQSSQHNENRSPSLLLRLGDVTEKIYYIGALFYFLYDYLKDYLKVKEPSNLSESERIREGVSELKFLLFLTMFLLVGQLLKFLDGFIHSRTTAPETRLEEHHAAPQRQPTSSQDFEEEDSHHSFAL